MNNRLHLIVLMAMLLGGAFDSCRKKNPVYILEGQVREFNSGSPVSGASLKLEQQSVEGNVFSGAFSTAATATSDGSGNYRMSWPRAQIARLRLTVSKPFYITSVVELNPDEFLPDESVSKNQLLRPEAFLQIQLRNIGVTETNDYLKFRVLSQFECACCTNNLLDLPGPSVDTTYTCRVYGNSWVRFWRESGSGGIQLVGNDSIWCPAFETSQLQINY